MKNERFPNSEATCHIEARAWRKAFGGVRVPKGVHRFQTHQEADEWLWWMIARPNQT
jgi:hypothetical protein